MKIIDQITTTVRDDMIQTIHKGSKVSIAAACFSIYAYQELKTQLESVEEIRFIFTSPTFVEEKTPKEKKEFYIPRISRERSLYGTEFEIKLRNELTQKAIARECADWIRRKVRFRSNTSRQQMMGFINVDENTYMPINGFTTVDLGCERGNNAYYYVNRTEAAENGQAFLRLFDEIWNDPNRVQDVTELVVDSISTAYRENAPEFIYFFTLMSFAKLQPFCPRVLVPGSSHDFSALEDNSLMLGDHDSSGSYELFLWYFLRMLGRLGENHRCPFSLILLFPKETDHQTNHLRLWCATTAGLVSLLNCLIAARDLNHIRFLHAVHGAAPRIVEFFRALVADVGRLIHLGSSLHRFSFFYGNIDSQGFSASVQSAYCDSRFSGIHGDKVAIFINDDNIRV